MNKEAFLRCGSVMTLSPGKLLVGWGAAKRASHPPTKGAFFFTDFFLTQKKPWICHAEQAECSVTELQELLGDAPDPPPISWENFYKKPFFKAFEELQLLLKSKKLLKGVPYAFETALAEMDSQRLHSCLQRALSATHGTVYGSWNETQGILGVTPELLFAQEGGKITSQALAGTGSKDTVQTPKNQVEHAIVIQGIVEALHSFGKVFVGSTHQIDLPHLSHLSTPIRLECITPPGFMDLIHALHPTPALGAFPNPLGKKWLLNYNHLLPRFYFGAPVGFLHKEQGRAFVAIRNMQWVKGVFAIGAGCGVVLESINAIEWAEIQLKIAAIKKTLGL